MRRFWNTTAMMSLVALGLSACGSPGVDDPRIAFNQAYQSSLDAFIAVQAMPSTDLATITKPSATYTGQSGLAISPNDTTLEDPSAILAQGGDFLAVADVTITVNFGTTDPTFTGVMSVIEADEGQSLSGNLSLSGQVDAASNLSGDSANALGGNLDGDLTLNGSTLSISSGTFTSGLIVGTDAGALWANHESQTLYNGDAGLITGGLYATE